LKVKGARGFSVGPEYLIPNLKCRRMSGAETMAALAVGIPDSLTPLYPPLHFMERGTKRRRGIGKLRGFSACEKKNQEED
jgi:hypothetical protein